MKRKRSIVFICILLLASFSLLCACAQKEKKAKVRVFIVPKFEIGEMSEDAAGEAQLFYEHYCPGCEEIAIPNTTPTSQFYFNKENGVGLLVTGSGKTAACMSLMSLLAWDAYDFSDAKIVSVGCGGASTGSYIFGMSCLSLRRVIMSWNIILTAVSLKILTPDIPGSRLIHSKIILSSC